MRNAKGQSHGPAAKCVGTRYVAYAIGVDGSRQRIEAHRIVIDLGRTEVDIDLLNTHPILAGELRISAGSDGALVVGHADASSIHVGVEAFGVGRLKAP